MPTIETQCGATAAAAARYIEEHLFDPEGFMMSAIDAHTGQPFEPTFITPIKVPRRADIDPWAFWTYEDCVMSTGLYMDALMRQYAVTGEARCVERCRALWHILRRIYSASQVHGIGSFLRPYGGWKGGLETLMHQFLEPLGTDQAGPMLAGLHLFRPHATPEVREEIDNLIVRTLRWYAEQGFSYFYYKNLVIDWCVANQHGASFFLPAVAWAAKRTRDPYWQRCRREMLALFHDPQYHIVRSFGWGSDLPVLADILGKAFARHLPRRLFDRAFDEALVSLSAYSGPEMVKYDQPGVAEGQEGVDPAFDRERGFGFAFFSTRHRGRTRPECSTLCGLAALGYPGALERARDVLAVFRRVPEDFTQFLHEDYEHLPETVHLYARSTGAPMVQWLRNYWLLREVEQCRPKPPWSAKGRRAARQVTDFIRTFRVSPLLPYRDVGRLSAPAPAVLAGFQTRAFAGAFADRHDEMKQVGLAAGAFGTGPFAPAVGGESKPPGDALVYYACGFRCAQPSRLRALLGYDGPLKVWIDGRAIFCDPDGCPPASLDDAAPSFAASAGDHEIVVALASKAGQAWGILLRLEQTAPRQSAHTALPEVLPVSGEMGEP